MRKIAALALLVLSTTAQAAPTPAQVQQARQAQCGPRWPEYKRQNPHASRWLFMRQCMRGRFDRYGHH